MPNLGFIAVKCVQCSIMQVKQQKKSSNKWTCAVCNQKQSVMSVFARGPQAKDLRFFVQNFNMARADSDFDCYLASDTSSTVGSGMTSFGGTDGGNDDEEDKVKNVCFNRNKRNDWSEYLDLEPNCEHERNGDKGNMDDEPGLFVTEMPNRVTGKRRRLFCSQQSRGKKSEPNLLLGVEAEDKERSPKVPKKMNASSSKWKEYLEEEVEKLLDMEQMTPPSKFSYGSRDESKIENQNQCRDVIVEDEIHPDFF